MKMIQEEDGTWTAHCERPNCGNFTSRNHPTKKAATERMKQHDDEHDLGIEAEHLLLQVEEGA
jgi:hypothetical protein